MNRTLPSLNKSNNSLSQTSLLKYDVKILDKIKSNIFFKVFKTDQGIFHNKPKENPLKKRTSSLFSKENLYEKIKQKQLGSFNTSFIKQNEKKMIEVIH